MYDKPRVYPFRLMRDHIKRMQAAVGLLFAVEGLGLQPIDFARFNVMMGMWRATKNPTYIQMLTAVGAWLRFYKSLIDRMPEGDLKTHAVGEYETINGEYAEVMPK